MRTIATFFLVSLILACPFICGAVELGHGPRQHQAGSPTNLPSPGHCPGDNDNCVCRGAVQSSDVRIPNSDSIGLPLPPHGVAGTLAHSPAHSLAHLTTDGSPTGLASWGDSVTVRAVLQNFRY